MSEASLTDIIQETLTQNPVADNLEIDEDLSGEDDLESSEAAVDELINGIPVDEDEDESDEDGEEESELDDTDLNKLQVKVDGEILEVTLKELKSGYQRQADYTRKAQALAAEKESFEQAAAEFGDTLGSLQQLDSAWEENPVKVLAHFASNTNNPTHSVALLIKELASAGLLDSEFMEVFGITSDVRETWGRESEVDNLRRRVASTEKNTSERLKEVEYEKQVQEAIADYDRQIDEILDGEGVDLTVSQRNAFRTRLATYAHDNELTNLKAAHKALKYEETQRKQAQVKKSVERAKQKKATSVVGRTSSGSSGATSIEDNSDLSAVIRAAMRDVSP
tara:strand:+ start:897 stop:1907 length:1011 start_codon:yes stop_codon:yes gene_type:complete